MYKKLIPFEKVSQLTKTDIAYSTGDNALMPFYKYQLSNKVFKQIIEDKSKANIPRELLVQALENQYATLPESNLTRQQIESLRNETTFTVTTAHQPCIFLGPVYFIYKAYTAINLAEAIKGLVGPMHKVVPVFVLGSEDHDLDELNHIRLFGKQVVWQPEGLAGPVGSMTTDSVATALAELKAIMGESDNARHLYGKIERAYTGQKTVARATQALLHDLFGKYGLIVLDMNDAGLKRHFAPVMRAELLEQPSMPLVVETSDRLKSLGFKPQAAPRDINLFYLPGNARERIVLEDDLYKVVNTDIQFTREAILQELDEHPERFSPNVVLRPLYQEMILPNLAYVGGGGELAYWLERKAVFEHFGVNYPVLVRRNSVLWLDRETSKRVARYGFTLPQMFDDADTLVRSFIEANASGEVNLISEIADMRRIFDRIVIKSAAVDLTLEKAARAEETKYIGFLEQWQSRLVRAEKQKHEVAIGQIRTLKDRLFPGGSLQERTESFIQFYLRHGEYFFNELKENLLPLEQGFVVLEEF